MKPARTIAAVFAAATATATLAFALTLFTPVQAIFTDDVFSVNEPTAIEAADGTLSDAPQEATFETVVTETQAIGEEVLAADAATTDTEASETVEDSETPAAAAAETPAATNLAVPVTGESRVRDYQPIMGERSLNVGGHIISYVDYYEQPSAPARGAGLWLGEDSTTDGSWGYFIGHNPGDFSGVMDLVEGNAVTVCDTEGLYRTYYVVDTFFVTTETTWQDIESRVTGYGESIILQTCVGDNAHYRVVVAC